MSITQHEFHKLLHDLKRIGEAIQIICEEDDKEKRKTIASLLRDELDRLYGDIDEARERNT